MSAQVAADLRSLARRTIGTCPKCRTVQTQETLGCWVYKSPCRSCSDGVVRMAYVVGVPTAKQCDARCTSARGRHCDCSCGGRRHGEDWDRSAR